MPHTDLYQNLPSDPEEAFLVLEERYRTECETKIHNSHENERTDVFYTAYIARVLGAITALDLTAEFEDRVPRIEDVDYNTYLNFSKDVEHYRTILLIKHGRRVQGYSVRFDTATKEKLRHHLRQMHELVEKSEIETEKKESLFSKLNALQNEIDRDRTRIEAYADLTFAVAGMLDTALEPINRVLASIARVFWGAQQDEIKRLPPPKPPKRIEGPKNDRTSQPRSLKTRSRNDMDDEIPF